MDPTHNVEEVAGSAVGSNENTDRISEFARRTREFGHYLNRQALDRGSEPVDQSDRDAFVKWAIESRQHTANPEAMDVEYVANGSPMDYKMLDIYFQQISELVRDRD